jgi:uncharacterized protein YgiM (DUF1202 family)
MKKLDWRVIVLLFIIISVAIGFLYGSGILGGSSGDPGSREDPLVTAGYADAILEQKVRDMDTRISALEAKIQSLEGELSILNGETADGAGDGTGSTADGAQAAPGSSSNATGGNTASQANIGKTGNVTGSVVNLRESASTSSNIKKKLSPSDTFTITKVDKNWYQVQLSDGTVGWVFADYVKVR